MTIINSRLYQALSTAFGEHVRVQSAGEPRRVLHLPDWDHGGRPRSMDLCSGEYYAVNCCFCGDLRQRLYFNHQWAERDPVTGNDNLHLVHCFNEGCIGSRARQKQLLHRVYPLGRSAHDSIAEPAIVEPTVSVVAPSPSLPDGIRRPIHQLDATHFAARYLIDRGFDLDYLWSTWEVYYCEHSAVIAPSFMQRIVIPVYTLQPRLGWTSHESRLAGWQARHIGDCPDGVPKYLSCKGMKKSQLLYGLPIAVRSTGPVVVVEGPTDAWRLGTNTVALFGKDMSLAQQQLLDQYFRNRPIVLFLDRDARDNAVDLRKQFRSRGGDRRVVLAEPPAGRNDVGDCTPEEAWQQVNLALEQVR